MGVVEDVLQTRLDLVGLGAYTSGFGQAAQAVGFLDGKLSDVERRRLSFSIGGLAAATGLLVGIGKASLAAGDSQEILNRAVRNFKGSFPSDELDDFAGSVSRLTGIDDEAIVDMLGLLGTFQVPKQDAKALALPILNATEALKAQGATADQIAIQVGKALQTGDPAALRRSGVILDQVAFKAADAAGRAKLLSEALNAQGGANAAEEYRKSLQGSLQALNTEFGNLQENFGKGGVNPFTGIVNGATSLLQLLNGMPEDVWEKITLGSVLLAGSLAVTSLRAGIAVRNIGRLAKENVELQNEQLKAGKSADGQAGAETRDGEAMTGADSAAKKLTSGLKPLADAHDKAADAARRQAEQEERLGRAGGGTSTGTKGPLALPAPSGKSSEPDAPESKPKALPAPAGSEEAAANSAKTALGVGGTAAAGAAALKKLGKESAEGAERALELNAAELAKGHEAIEDAAKAAAGKTGGAVSKLNGPLGKLKSVGGKIGEHVGGPVGLILTAYQAIETISDLRKAITEDPAHPRSLREKASAGVNAAGNAAITALSFTPTPAAPVARGLQGLQLGLDLAGSLLPKGGFRDAVQGYGNSIPGRFLESALGLPQGGVDAVMRILPDKPGTGAPGGADPKDAQIAALQKQTEQQAEMLKVLEQIRDKDGIVSFGEVPRALQYQAIAHEAHSIR